jgi:cytochrome P450 family 135
MRAMALPPGPNALPAINLARYARDPIGVIEAWRRRHGDVFTLPLAFLGTGVYVARPELIRELFTGDQSDLRAGAANSFLEPMVGPRSVLVVDGPEHMRQRRLLLAPFHGDRIAAFRESIRDVTARELASWRPGVRLSLRERMRRITFEVMCRAVIGVDDPSAVDALRASVGRVIDSHPLYLLTRLARADLGRFSPGGRYRSRLRAADELLLAEIARRRTSGATGGADVLSLALEWRDGDGRQLADGELRDLVFTLLAAGHETTATSIAFALELLIHNRAALDRLRDELACDRHDQYLEATVKEALRLRPPLDNVQRKLARARQVGGYELPAGVMLYPGIITVHLNAELYSDPYAFRPERFLGAAPAPYGWIPFGGGIRRCVGASLAQAELAEVLRVAVSAVELRAVRNRPDPVVLRGITLAPKHGAEVEVLSSAMPARGRAPGAS